MRLALLCVLLVLGVTFAQRINEAELNNKSIVMKRIKCILDQGPCDRTGQQLKAAIPEVLQRNCRKCTESQRAGARRLITFTMQRYPAEWAQIQAKYSG